MNVKPLHSLHSLQILKQFYLNRVNKGIYLSQSPFRFDAIIMLNFLERKKNDIVFRRIVKREVLIYRLLPIKTNRTAGLLYFLLVADLWSQ